MASTGHHPNAVLIGRFCDALGRRDAVPDALYRDLGRHPRSQSRPSGRGFAPLAGASLGGKARSAKAAPMTTHGPRG